MFLKTLRLKNFRLYKDAFFEFSPHLNVFYGGNAQGKTTLLEAIYFLMTGRSFRASQASDLILSGAAFFFLEIVFVKHGIEQKLSVFFDGKTKKIIHNQTSYASTTHLLGLLQGVASVPDDVALVKGPPLIRRQFLDIQNSQKDPLYVHYLTRFGRAMRQRNLLLKSRQIASIHPWEEEMSRAAAYIVEKRAFALELLGQAGKKHYESITRTKEDLCLSYRPSGLQGDNRSLLQEHFLSLFQKFRKREMELGATLNGPHKDDFLIAIDEKDTRFYASEGQQRSSVVALKFAEWDCFYQTTGESPIMLIDDVGLGLDDERKKGLFNKIRLLKQVFLTSASELSDYIELGAEEALFEIKNKF